MDQLEREAERFDVLKPRFIEQLKATQLELDEMNPSISTKRAAYSELFEKRSTVQNALNLIASIAELEDRKIAIEAATPGSDTRERLSSDLSASTLDEFSTQMENVLKSWNFPDASQVYFDKDSLDFVISGKPRGSRGKGIRAITYAAFTISLLEYTRANELPHPGFAVLNSPLLAYREPEGDEDDLSGTDVQDLFYKYLAGRDERQVLILENNDPPLSI